MYVFRLSDYLGNVNFCLRESDTPLSLPSRSKVLNAVTNNVFRSLIIGNEQMVKDTQQLFDAYREMVDETPCDLSAELVSTGKSEFERACVQDQLTAKLYMDALFELLTAGATGDAVFGGIYDRGYKRLLTALRDAGCKFSEKSQRPTPADVNICLSLLDISMDCTTLSKTSTLNAISNCVSRAILYGSRADQRRLASILEEALPKLIIDWFGDLGDNMNNQEALYVQALILYLRDGLSVAQHAVAPQGEMNPQIRDEFRWVVDESRKLNETFPTLRLYDMYLNAFYRVVELCLNKLSDSGVTSPLNEEVILDFAQWEQSIRRNLTSKVWDQNPAELSGSWELIDVAGRGSLEVMMATPSEALFGVEKGVTIILRKDGSVEVGSDSNDSDMPSPSPVSPTSAQWFYRPGPAHLDTCEFTFANEIDSEKVLLTYTGYIDRGQRIESRLSNRPIRMTGRVMSTIDGKMIGSGRFIMVLRRSKSLWKKSSPTTAISRSQRLDGGPALSFPEGERRVVDYDGGQIIVTKNGGELYAIDARCPHLGLPMKRGKIIKGDNANDPTITCNFHNSEFSLKDGSCKIWCSKVMGVPGTEWIAKMSSKFGAKEFSPATVYKVEIENERVVVLL